MACTTYALKGIARGCKDSIGGIVKVFIGTNIDGIRDEVEGGEGNTTSIADVSEFVPFEFFAKTGSMESTMNYSETAGNSFTTNVNLVFIKQEASKRLEIMGLCMQEFVMCVIDKNGKGWWLGETGNGYCSAATATTGTQPTDANAYNVTLTFDEAELPMQLDATTVGKLNALEIA